MHGRLSVFAAFVAGLVVAPMMVWAQPADTSGAAAAPPPPADYHPTTSDMMTLGIQPRHIKVALALKAQNWAYLAYETNELKNMLGRIARTVPVIDRKYDMQAMIQSTIAMPLQDLADAAKARDAAKANAAYSAVTQSCNACHQAVMHGVIVVKNPPDDFYPDQDFQPRP